MHIFQILYAQQFFRRFLSRAFTLCVHGRDNKVNITQMWRRWGTPQNFFLPFIDELEKQIIIKKKKKLLKWANKKQINFNICNVVFF